MSRIEPGTYVIYSCALGPNGQRLAMTFNGNGEPITVTPLEVASSKQHWVIENYDNELQHAKPQDSQHLEAGWTGSICTLPIGNYVWRITKDEGWVIRDGSKTIKWSIDGAASGNPVVAAKGTTGETQRWIFHHVDTPLPAQHERTSNCVIV